MWINRFLFCLFRGHSYIDIVSTARPYKYCMRCGKIKEYPAECQAVTVHIHTRNNR